MFRRSEVEGVAPELFETLHFSGERLGAQGAQDVNMSADVLNRRHTRCLPV